MMAIFEEAAGYLRGDTHRTSEYDRGVGIVHVFLRVQSMRLGKQEQEKGAQITFKGQAEQEALKGELRISKNVSALEKERSFWRKASDQ